LLHIDLRNVDKGSTHLQTHQKLLSAPEAREESSGILRMDAEQSCIHEATCRDRFNLGPRNKEIIACRGW
jgi:hypothetical protein